MADEYLGMIRADKRIKQLESELAEFQNACIDIYNDYDKLEVTNYCSRSVGKAWELGGKLLSGQKIKKQTYTVSSEDDQ